MNIEIEILIYIAQFVDSPNTFKQISKTFRKACDIIIDRYLNEQLFVKLNSDYFNWSIHEKQYITHEKQKIRGHILIACDSEPCAFICQRKDLIIKKCNCIVCKPELYICDDNVVC